MYNLFISAQKPETDVFSFGIVMWEILTEKVPYADMQVLQIVRAIDLGKRPEVPEGCDSNFVALMEKCWSDEVKERPDFDAIYDELQIIANKEVEKELERKLEMKEKQQKQRNEEMKLKIKNWFSGEDSASETPPGNEAVEILLGSKDILPKKNSSEK